MAWFPHALPHQIPNNTSCTTKAGGAVNVLGSPIGEPEACQQLFQKRLAKVELFWTRLQEIGDSQIAFQLLRFCGSVCKIIYSLRTTPTHIISSDINSFDVGMRRVFEELHGKTTNQAWFMATLPFKMGGLGLIEGRTIAELCYISSFIYAQKLIYGLLPSCPFSPTVWLLTPHEELQKQWNLPDKYSLSSMLQDSFSAVDLQKDLTQFVQLIRLREYLPPIDSRDAEHVRIHARTTTTAHPTSSRVFSSLPDARIQTATTSPIWRTMVLMRTGNPLFNGSTSCLLCRRSNRQQEQPLDIYGHHASVCPCAEGSTRRHNSLRDFLFNYIRHNGIGLTVRKEEPLPQDNALPWNERRRLDLFIDDP